MLYDYLIETFGFNEPIFITDIDFNNYSKIWISKELARLCESNQIVRYEKGIYYIPQDTIFGKSSLNPNKVIKRKYLSDNGNSIGFLQVQLHFSKSVFLHKCRIFPKFKQITKALNYAESKSEIKRLFCVKQGYGLTMRILPF